MNLRLLLATLLVGVANGARFTHSTPYWVGNGGGMVLTITGSGFSEDQFNKFDATLGNTVKLVNELDTLDCKVISYLTNTEKIVCEIPKRTNRAASEVYAIKVFVDGVEASGSRTIQYHGSYSPVIERISPIWALPGELVEIAGHFHTDRIQLQNLDDPLEDDIDSGRILTGAYVGNVECSMVNDTTGELFVPFDSRKLTCQVTSQNIAPMNGSAFVLTRGASENRWYGMWSDSQDKLYQHHTYGGVNSVSPSTGSSGGRTLITVTGVGFSNIPGATEVRVGGAVCDIQSISQDSVTCLTPAEADTSPGLRERGFLWEFWEGEYPDISKDDQWYALDSTHESYTFEYKLDIKFDVEMSVPSCGKLTGYLNLPHDGEYSFGFHAASAWVRIYIAPNGNPADIAFVNYWEKVTLSKDTPPYIEVRYRGTASTEFRGLMNDFAAKHSRWQTHMAQDEKQRLTLDPTEVRERQTLEFSGTPAASSLYLNGLLSAPIDVTDTEQVSSAILGMVEQNCEIVATDPSFSTSSGYEDESTHPPGRRGSIIDTVEPFCGRHSFHAHETDPKLYDQSTIADMVDILEFNYVCFAVKGNLKHTMRIEYYWWDIWNRWRSDSVYLEHTYTSDQDTWDYRCHDMYQAMNDTWITTQRKPDAPLKVRRAFAPKPLSEVDDVYVDEFSFSNENIDVIQTRPSALKTQGILINDVRVTKLKDNVTLQVEFFTSNCFGNFPLLGVTDGAANPSWVTELDSSATEASFTVSGGIVNVTRTKTATNPVTGTWSMDIFGTTISGIAPDVNPHVLQAMVNGAMGTSDIVVTDSGHCGSKKWHIEWLKDPGFKPLITIDDSQLIFDGESLSFVASHDNEGRLWHDPIRADFVIVHRDEPHVSVSVNGYRSACLGDCSYSFTTSGVPTLTSVAGSMDGSGVHTLTITGSGFTSSDLSDFSVTAGSYDCEVTAVSSSSVTCTVSYLPAGNYPVSVAMQPIGAALQPDPALTYNVPLSVTSVSPSTGGTGGGYSVTVMGTGFPEDLDGWSDGSVTFGGVDCDITAADGASVTCTAPAGTAGSVDVSVLVGGMTSDLTDGFTYDAGLSASITSVSPTSSNVVGGDELTITGTGFGDGTDGYVKVGPNMCENTTWTDTSITCLLPSNNPGVHAVSLYTGSQGFASNDDSVSVDVTYTFKVTGSSATTGSVYGGTIIVLDGEGFGTDCSLLEIEIGTGMVCDVIECSDSQLTCKTRLVSVNHDIKNTGSHPGYGPGFAWSPKVITITAGDSITWAWSKPDPLSQSLYSVFQTATAIDLEYDGTGFNSGSPTSSGAYTVEFPRAGTFFYAGSPVIDEDEAHVMSGQINVVEPSESANMVVVKLGEVEAEYELSSSPSVSVDGCASIITAPLGGCSSTAPSAPDADSLYFVSDLCLTPTVTGISASATESIPGLQGIQVRTGATLTITGTGFGTMPCQSSVMVGPASCTVTVSSDTSITCDLDDDSNVVSLKAFPVTVTIANRGVAAVDIANFLTEGQVTIVPVVSAFTPVEGSTAGGTLITITGTGLLAFDNQVSVSLSSGSCTIEDNTATSVTCTTSATAASTATLNVYVSGFSIPAISDMLSSTYTFSAASTPSVSAISVSDGTITITGSSFGTTTVGVTVTITPVSSRHRRNADKTIPVETKKREIRYQTTYDDDDEMHVYDEEVKESRSGRRPKISSDLFEPLEVGAGFWAKFTNTEAKTFEESVRLGAWKIGGSNSQYKQDLQAAHKERVFRAKREASVRSESYSCTVTSVTDTSIECTASGIPASSYAVEVNIADLGTAESSVSSVTVSPTISSISPTQGSTNGGALLTISGSGFNPGDLSVTLDGVNCPLESESASSLTCRVPSHAVGAATVEVTSASISVTSPTDFTYESSITPILTTVSPDTGITSGMTLTLTGSGFKSSATDPTVMIGGADCTIVSASDTSIDCTSPDIVGGSHYVFVRDAQYGDSNSVSVSYDFTVTSVSPSTGGFGGAEITITGLGFEPSGGSSVTVCGSSCSISSGTSSSIVCLAPPYTGGGSSVPCDVEVTNPDASVATSVGGFTYDSSLTPAVTSISPKRGGTAGGTTLTITGTGFAVSGNEVSIDGSPCIVSSETTAQIVCDTEPHEGPGTFQVVVKSPGLGHATTDENAEFFYIDRWSSVFTWGGNAVPGAGQLVVITEGQTILLDQSTDVLKAIIIQGGHLVFDDEASSELILRAEYILIVDGGSLSIGSEENRFENEAVIELHGNTQSIELPMYGAKVLAVRNGTLDLHGSHIPITWTHLASTASVGDTQITLKQAVTWKAGDEIIIATTEHRFMENQNEKRTIASVSGDGLTVTLTEALEYEHISIEQTLGGRTIETRAEVGLLTRNVKVRGNINTDFSEVIEACDTDWKPGQFETQSCFNGRFGEEMGSDQFGATIMLFGKYANQDLVAGRLEYVEVTEAGQAFSLGRYPIHFHLVGNVSSSYVRGCAVHRTYNRAVTIHAADYLTIEHNVVYNNMGHAIFTEDGIEQFNIIQYNLAVYTRTSSSLLNVDVTPSSYWVVNPNNIVRHNAAASGTHFGYWYRLERNPSGPSATNSYCQNNEVMGEFRNNSAHSYGRYGLWVFSMDGYFPKDGTCRGQDLVAEWHDFTVWRCDRGAEVVFGGALQFHNFVTLDNEHAGLEMVKVESTFGEDGPGVFNSLVIGHSALTPDGCTSATSGIIGPKQYIFNIADTKFVNFDTNGCTALSGCSQCKEKQGGFHIQVKGLSFENSPNKMRFKWEHETIWIDADGSLTGTAEATVVPSMGILDPSNCQIDVAEFSVNSEVPGSVCNNMKFLRFNVQGPDISPDSLQGRDIIVSNAHGSTDVPYRIKRLTTEGWMGILPTGDTYQWEFANAVQVTNMSYVAEIRHIDVGDYLFISHELTQRPDSFGTTGEQQNSTDAMPDPVVNVHGDYYWNNDTRTMTYLVSEKLVSRRRRRNVIFEDRPHGTKRTIDFEVYRCYFENCIPPTVPPVPTGRPDVAFRWSDTETWKEVPVGSGGHPTEDTYGLPVEGDEIIIPPGMWMIVDTATPALARVYVYGAIEFEDTMDHTFSAAIIYIQGGSVVAGFSEDAPFTHDLNIILRGSLDPDDPDNVDMPMPPGVPNVGWKAIGVFGLLSLHGEHHGSTWSKLGATASAGDSVVTLADAAHGSWVNKEVMITTTSKDVMETEIRTITAVSGSTITLDSPLDYEHLGESFTLSDGTTSFTMAGEVGILSRNIRIEGNDYAELEEDSFGGRIVVSKLSSDGVEYVGQAQLSNVELKNMGQIGFTDTNDPRYSLAFVGLDTDDGSNYVKGCSFNKNYNVAVGMFGTNNLTIEDNVIYHTVGSCIRDDSSDNMYRGNLLSVMLFPGTYNGANEIQNLDWFGAFSLNKATDPVLEDNVVGGSEQAGYQTFGELCEDTSLWLNNEVHSAIYGVMIWRKGSAQSVTECRSISNVYAWRIWDTAFYMQHYTNFLVSNVQSVDSRVGVNQISYAPPSLSHQYTDKTATIEDSTFVGASPLHTCEYQASNPDIFDFSGKVLWSGGINGGYSGLVFASFVSTPNMAPKFGFSDADSYPALHGGMYVRNTVFANYGTRTCGTDVALITNPKGDDGIHPIFTSGLTFIDTPENNYIFMQEPNLGAVNPSDCVDMDCDGLKKIVITDNDGTLLGSADATATAMAEFEWDGDPSRGVGDYRIPVSLRQRDDGTEITAAEKFPNKGIIRDDSCTLMSAWRAWKCTGLTHRMMIIESMDSDTEIRRLSPIALIANPGTNGYVDLLNGPMDRGWCFGYTCQERISTFYSIVASGITYEMAMTSTPPQVIRFHLLHSDVSETVLLRIFFPKMQRYDVYVDDTLVLPTNIDTGATSYQLLPIDPDNPTEFYPTHSDAVGSNFLERNKKMLHVLLKGGHTVEIKTRPMVVLTTGAVVSEGDFFEENLIANMAAMLGVSEENIVITNIVRESRRKRSGTISVTATFEVSSAPTSTLNGTESDVDGDILGYDELVHSVANLVNAFQTTECDNCNVSMSSLEIEDPIPPPEEAGEPATEEFGAVVVEGGDLFSNLQQEEDNDKLNNSLQATVYSEPSGSTVEEGVSVDNVAFTPFEVQPVITVQTSDGSAIQDLGYSSEPWEYQAVLTGGPPGAMLLGDTIVQYVDGSANFTNLLVNKPGDGYSLNFVVVFPDSVSGLDAGLSYTFRASDKSVTLMVTSEPLYVNAETNFYVDMALYDNDTGMPIDPSALTGQTLTGSVKLANTKKKGKLTGNKKFTLTDGDISEFSVGPLKLSQPGSNYRLKVEIDVAPAGWTQSIKTNGIPVLSQDLVIPDSAKTWKISMKGLWGKGRVVKGREQEFINKLNNELITKIGGAFFNDFIVTGRRPKANFMAMGSTEQLEEVQDKLCNAVMRKGLMFRIKRQRFIMSKLRVKGVFQKKCEP